jgi:hypothetical protein
MTIETPFERLHGRHRVLLAYHRVTQLPVCLLWRVRVKHVILSACGIIVPRRKVIVLLNRLCYIVISVRYFREMRKTYVLWGGGALSVHHQSAYLRNTDLHEVLL